MEIEKKNFVALPRAQKIFGGHSPGEKNLRQPHPEKKNFRELFAEEKKFGGPIFDRLI